MAGNFGFVVPGVLAGMEQPGSAEGLARDLQFLRERGIGAIVSLTDRPLDAALVLREGFDYLHLPVRDFAAPEAAQVAACMEFLERARAGGRATVIHCGAGRGRTGTMLACALVHLGEQAETAILRLRELRPGSIETEEQERCVHQFAARRRMKPHGS